MSAELTAQLSVGFPGSSAEQIARSGEILYQRFREFVTPGKSWLSVAMDHEKVTAFLSKLNLSEADAKELASLQGDFQVLFGGRVLITDADIDSANMQSNIDGPFVSLRLSASTAQRLRVAWGDDMDQPMAMTWEGHPIRPRPVLRDMHRELIFDAPQEYDTRLMVVVLRHGKLPETPASVELQKNTSSSSLQQPAAPEVSGRSH